MNGNVIQDFLSKLTRNAQGLYGEEAYLLVKSTGEQSRQGINVVRRTAMELGMDSAQAVSYQMTGVAPLAQFIVDQLNRGVPKPVELTPVIPPVPPPTIDHSERILLVQQCQALEEEGNHPKRTPEYYANATLEDLRSRAQILQSVEPLPSPNRLVPSPAPYGVPSMTVVDRPDLQLRLTQVLALSDEQILEQVSPDDLKNLVRFVGIDPPARLRRQTLIRFLRNPAEAKAQLGAAASSQVVDAPLVEVPPPVTPVQEAPSSVMEVPATILESATNTEALLQPYPPPQEEGTPYTLSNEEMRVGNDSLSVKIERIFAQNAELLGKVSELNTRLESMDRVMALYADFRNPLPPNVKTCFDVVLFRFPGESKS